MVGILQGSCIPPPLTGIAALQYMHESPKEKEQVCVTSHEDGEVLEELVISAFYEAGMIADEIVFLMTVYDADEICEGDTLFVVEKDNFLVITGNEKSVVSMTPLDSTWIQFGSGYFRQGSYTAHGTLRDLSTPFPSEQLRVALFPERLIVEGNVYKLS